MEAQFVRSSVPCTCGELFQGSLEGEPCLVSCPIAIYSTAQAAEGAEGEASLGRKARQASLKLSPKAGLELPISIHNPLPVGRGYGTSTADIGAALYLVSAQLGLPLSGAEASRLAVSIEPTDSTLFPELTLFAHRTGAFFEPLGPALAAQVLILDPGGFVDSESFNAQDWRPQLKKLALEHRQAFSLLQFGIAAGDLLAIGEACTLDARLHQAILLNPLFEKVLELGRELRAAGLCRAHSGTLLGLLFDEDRCDSAEMISYCRKRLPAEIQLQMTSLVDGGPRISAGKMRLKEE
jgi:L-threonine kinase